MHTVAIASFVTGLRAASLVEALAAAHIVKGVTTSRAKWTNKKLPPPRIEVGVLPADVPAARVVLEAFNQGKA